MRITSIYNRHQSSKPILSLLVTGLILTAVSIGCTSTDLGVASEEAIGKVTPLPVGADNSKSNGADYGGSSTIDTPSGSSPPSSSDTQGNSATGDPLATPKPGSTLLPTNAELSLNLTILAPTQGAGLEVGAIRVLGVTLADAEVSINGLSTEVGPDGSFTRDLILGEGINSVEATAKNDAGQEVSESLVVLFVPRTEGIPLSILFPQGLEVSDPNLTIMGATRPDAVLGVNGVPVDINSLGIFSTSVVLEEGTNLVEVVAVDLDENVNFQTVVVFYIP